VRRKLYIDGDWSAARPCSTRSRWRARVGSASAPTRPARNLPFTGQVDGAFVTGYALTFADVATLYAKGSQALGASPKNAGDHIERMDATSLYLIADTLESQHTLDVGVTA
jgi:hypothetical protein